MFHQPWPKILLQLETEHICLISASQLNQSCFPERYEPQITHFALFLITCDEDIVTILLMAHGEMHTLSTILSNTH